MRGVERRDRIVLRDQQTGLTVLSTFSLKKRRLHGFKRSRGSRKNGHGILGKGRNISAPCGQLTVYLRDG